MTLTHQIRYQVEPDLSADEFIGILEASTLAARRPVADRPCIDGMLSNADLIITARAGAHLVGVARSVTDFHYCCYLSDLAVDHRHQREGIDKRRGTAPGHNRAGRRRIPRPRRAPQSPWRL